MDNYTGNVESSELLNGQDTQPVEQNINILQEVRDIEEKLRSSDFKSYKRSTSWHQQSIGSEEQIAVQKDMLECLLRIEAKLAKLETFLEK